MNIIIISVCIILVVSFIYSAVVFRRDVKRSDRIKEFYLSKLEKLGDNEDTVTNDKDGG